MPGLRLAVVETNSHGGMLHYAAQLADGLAAAGHQVDLIVPPDDEVSVRRSQAPAAAGSPRARLRAVLVPQHHSGGAAPAVAWRRQLRRLASGQRLLRSAVRVVRQCRKGRYDAVVVQWELVFWIFSAASRLLLLLPHRPQVVFILHNVRPFNRWGRAGLYLDDPRVNARIRGVLARVDLVVVHGAQSRAECLDTWPVRRVAVVPHGDERVLAEDVPPDADHPGILFFGDWRKVKGLPVLMAAFDLLADSVPGATLTIAGSPAPDDFDDQVVRRWAAERGARVRVLPHYVPVTDVPSLFAAARVVVTPYLVGYQSGVVHLAMTMGRPVVCSDVGDLATAVGHGECGLVVPAGDADALAEALTTVLEDPALAARMGAAGRRRAASQASWERAGQVLAEAILDVVRPAAALAGRAP